MAMLLNKKETRQFILDMREKYRPGWNADRVSEQSIEVANAFLKAWVVKQIQQQPTIGKTIIFTL